MNGKVPPAEKDDENENIYSQSDDYNNLSKGITLWLYKWPFSNDVNICRESFSPESLMGLYGVEKQKRNFNFIFIFI